MITATVIMGLIMAIGTIYDTYDRINRTVKDN